MQQLRSGSPLEQDLIGAGMGTVILAGIHTFTGLITAGGLTATTARIIAPTPTTGRTGIRITGAVRSPIKLKKASGARYLGAALLWNRRIRQTLSYRGPMMKKPG